MAVDGPRLTDPIRLAGRQAPSRVMFGPHETNLGSRRSLSRAHAAYYSRRARGGVGIVVTETASVHESDWPYERAPLAADCVEGWRLVAEACRAPGALVLAGLGHTGLQGSSAYSQAALWGPSRFADPASREVPMQMEQPEIDAVVAGFAAAADLAALADLDGVEVDAGAGALLRQFHSGLTNRRADDYGADRLRLTRDVLAAVRQAIGPNRVLALRLSCDELAPWAGVTPEAAAAQAAELADMLDLLVVVRGGPYSPSGYRPDSHTPPAFNTALARAIRVAVAGAVPVVLQGSVVEVGSAQAALDDGAADIVEMTRAQIADADLVVTLRAGTPERIRPCLLCNQTCRVRDNRNPIVTCVADPRSGHETQDPDPNGHDSVRHDVVVVGGGASGLEAARVLATRGHRVRVVERSSKLGGALRQAAVGPGRQRLALLVDWLEAECRRLGVEIETGRSATACGLEAARASGSAIVLATGSRPVRDRYGTVGSTEIRDALAVLTAGPDALPAGPVLVHDPVGGPIGVAVAEWLADAGREVAIVTQDQIVGRLLSLSGDLADANTRLQRKGVTRHLRSLLRSVGDGRLLLEDVWTGVRHEVVCAVLVDCGHRLPEESLYEQLPGSPRGGDCVAPRSVHEAVLEGRRMALEIGSRAVLPVAVPAHPALVGTR